MLLREMHAVSAPGGVIGVDSLGPKKPAPFEICDPAWLAGEHRASLRTSSPWFDDASGSVANARGSSRGALGGKVGFADVRTVEVKVPPFGFRERRGLLPCSGFPGDEPGGAGNGGGLGRGRGWRRRGRRLAALVRDSVCGWEGNLHLGWFFFGGRDQAGRFVALVGYPVPTQLGIIHRRCLSSLLFLSPT